MDKVTGLHILYYNICKRKLWYYIKECAMEDESELVHLGRIIDEESYGRDDKHIDVLGYAKIDAIHGDIIRETKKSNKMEEAAKWQMKYYLYILKENNSHICKGEIDYPKLKQKKEVTLSDEDISELKKMIDGIYQIANSEIPENEDKKICKSCAYFDLCKI